MPAPFLNPHERLLEVKPAHHFSGNDSRYVGIVLSVGRADEPPPYQQAVNFAMSLSTSGAICNGQGVASDKLGRLTTYGVDRSRPFASIRDSPPALLQPHVLVRADVNMDAVAAIMNVFGRDHRRLGRARSRPTTAPAPTRANVNALQINDLPVPAEHARGRLAAKSRGQLHSTTFSEAVDGATLGSVHTREAGKTNCQAHSLGAFAYLRSSANGRTTRAESSREIRLM